MSEKLVPITIKVSVADDDLNIMVTNAPYFIIIDPQSIKKELLKAMDDDEIDDLAELDNDEVISIVSRYTRGPFFSPESALRVLPLVKHRCYMSDAAQAYCASGWANQEFCDAYAQAKKENGVYA